jgi:ADP-heptose:LPS heptosyltransferase
VKPSLTRWIKIDRLFAPAAMLSRWILEPLTIIQSGAVKDVVVMKFFGMGSLIRFFSLCEQNDVDLSRIVLLTFSANKEVCEMWGVRGIFIDKGSIGEMTRGSINALRSLSRLKPHLLLDLERNSNLAAVFRAVAAVFAGCRSIGFELRSRQSRVCTVYSVTELNQHEIFLKGIEALPPQRHKHRRAATTTDIDGGKVIININTSELLPARRYDVESFASVIQRLSEFNPRFTFYLTGSANEREYVQRLTDQLEPLRVINVAGQWSLKQFAHELSECRLFITGDSAPLHLAASMNVTTIAIWGPTQPHHFGYHASGTFHPLTLSLPCSPCFLHPGSRAAKACNGKITCMKDLAPGFIVAQVIGVMSTLPSSREVIFPIELAPQPVDAIA